MSPQKPKAAPFLIASLLLIAACVWMLEHAHEEALLSLESERRRRRELEEQLERKDEEMNGALDKINELRSEPAE